MDTIIGFLLCVLLLCSKLLLLVTVTHQIDCNFCAIAIQNSFPILCLLFLQNVHCVFLHDYIFLLNHEIGFTYLSKHEVNIQLDFDIKKENIIVY